MSDKRQYHFVVMYNAETGEFEMDYDTQDAKFQNAPIYNPDTDEWEELEEEHFMDDNTTYNRSGDALALALRDLRALPEK